MKQEWVAAYYPSEVIDDQRLKTLVCLLFDKVVLHFPVSGTVCGGAHGISNDFSDDPLVEVGVLELIEDYLIDDIEEESPSADPGGSAEARNQYFDLNVTALALRYCKEEGAVPVTDNADTPIPICAVAPFDLKYAADVQASALAIQSLDLLLSAFAPMNSHDILEARQTLKDQLAPFRAAMFALAPKVRSGISAGAPLAQVYREAKYIAETDVAPRLADLRRHLAMERGTFWRKLVQKVGSRVPGIALKWMSGAGVSATIDAAKAGSSIATQVIENDVLVHNLLSSGGLGYLVNLQAHIEERIACKRHSTG